MPAGAGRVSVQNRSTVAGEHSLAPEDEADLLRLAAGLVAIPSVSRSEEALAGFVEARLRARGRGLSVDRIGNCVVARTGRGLARRVILSGHLDTVPGVQGARVEDDELTGLGAVDMKGGLAVMLLLAEQVESNPCDTTFVFYDGEELGSERSGLTRLFAQRPDLVAGDFAVVLEPTGNWLEAGCQGTAVFEVVFNGKRAHSARPWLGVNAVARAVPALNRLASCSTVTAEVEGLLYRGSLPVVGLPGGVATSVRPDECIRRVSRRYAPSHTLEEVTDEVRRLADGADRLTVLRSSPAGRPRLDHPLVAAFQRDLGLRVRPKLGTTDVGRFSLVGIPAVNFGPGSAEMAHTSHEVLSASALSRSFQGLSRFLGLKGE